MFCNNCGNQLQEGQRFCAKCGAEAAQAAPAVCEKCGAELVEGAKFCNVCGTAVAGQKSMFCQFCGQKFEEGETFCGKCGNKLSGKAAPKGASVNVGTGGENAVTRWFASTGSPLLTPFGNMLAFKQLILGVIMLFFFIFSLVPSFKIWGYFNVSMVNIWGGFELVGNDYLILEIFGSIVEVSILLGLIAAAILPVYKNEWYSKPVLSILSIILTAGRFFFCFIWLVVFDSEYYIAKLTFGGVMYVLFAAAACVFSIYLHVEHNKLSKK